MNVNRTDRCVSVSRTRLQRRKGPVAHFMRQIEKSVTELEEPRLTLIFPPYGRIKKVEGGEKKEQQGLPALIQVNDIYR